MMGLEKWVRIIDGLSRIHHAGQIISMG